MKKILLLFAALFALLHTYGQAISLDSSFAGKGWTYTDFKKGNFYNEQGRQVLLQKDGAIIVVLYVGSPYIILARYLPDGSLDPGFGTDGYSEPIFMSSAGGLQPRVALQSDDKIVVASASGYYENRDITLSRYTTHGAVDKSFGTGGVIQTDLGGTDNVFSLAVQSDDRIVVAGSTYDYNTSRSSLVLLRYTKDGTLDGSFDGDGKLTTELGDYYQDVFMDVQADGTIVVCRTFQNPNPEALNIVLTLYHPDGTPDVSFDGDGKLVTNFFKAGTVTSLAVQNDGKILLAGNALLNAEQSDFALRRYNADGSVDNGFGDEGKQTTDFGGDDFPISLVVQSDGKIVVAGYTMTESFGHIDIAVARYQEDGAPDAGFDDDGKLTTDFNNLEGAFSLAVQSDGKLVVTGISLQLELFAEDYILVRYNADGSLNSGFGSDGKLIGYYPAGLSGVNSLAVQSDGKIVVAGGSGNPDLHHRRTEATFSGLAVAAPRLGQGTDVGLARYNANGSPDPSFGTNGKQVVDLDGIDEATSLVVQADGKILIAGVSVDTLTNRPYLFLTRLNADGTFDISFDGDGKLVTGYYGAGEEQSLLLQRDGKIVVTGIVFNSEGPVADFAIVRYNADGSLDNSFNGTGRSVVDFGSPAAAFSLAMQDDGKIIAAGRVQDLNANNIDFGLARYNTDGSLDHSFGDNGRLTTDFASGFDLVTSVAIQADGKIVLAGVTFTYHSGNQYVVLSRYNQDGSLDSSFDGDGKLTSDLFDWEVDREPALAASAVGLSFSASLDLQSNGKLVVAGTTRHHSYYQDLDFALARYHEDGAPDSSFGHQGKLTQDFLQGEDYATALRIARNHLYVVGTSTMNAPIQRGVLAAYRFDCAEQERCGNRLDDNCDGQIDEGCPSQPFFTLNDVTVAEDLQRATLMVKLSKKTSEPVSFSYFTQDRTAVSKANKGQPDFEAVSGTITIPAGRQTAVISINIFNDDLAEGEEFFEVHLQRPVHAALSGDKARVTIQDAKAGDFIPLVTAPGAQEERLPSVPALSVKVQPNPSAASFTLSLQSQGNAPVVLKVTDATGRLVEMHRGLQPNTTLQLGQSYRPGIYYLEALQGTQRASLKLVKQAY